MSRIMRSVFSPSNLRIVFSAHDLVPLVNIWRRLRRRTITALRMMCGALPEGLAAHREYEELRSRGIAHEAALRQALGIGRNPSRLTRDNVAPLCFAGRA